MIQRERERAGAQAGRDRGAKEEEEADTLPSRKADTGLNPRKP